MNIILEQGEQISTELEQKTQEYMNYLQNHIDGVIKAYKTYFLPLVNNKDISVGDFSNQDLITAIKKAALLVDKHDLSKYNDLEFYPYRRHFYPTIEENSEDEDRQQIAEIRYEEAWKHHYEHNMHHIEYWYDWSNSTPRDMPLENIIEMICDWISMSYYFNEPIDKWWKNVYESEKERSMMTSETIGIVDELFDIIQK